MNTFFDNIIKVIFTGFITLLLFNLYNKYISGNTIENIIKNNDELLEQYKQYNKHQMIIFIIGAIIGIIIFFICDINDTKKILPIVNTIDNISDINVI
jgi:hypothetical protein